MDITQTIRAQLYPKQLNTGHVKYALDYQPRECDRILMAYPKCGTNWCRYTILAIMGFGHIPDHFKSSNRRTFLETLGSGVLAPREGLDSVANFFHTHTRKLLSHKSEAKYLIVLRNPKDVSVSLYYYTKSNYRLEMDFHEFFKIWINGNGMPYGDYFEAMRTYWEHREDSNCTVITYEEMLANPRDSIVRIASFLGHKYVDRLYDRCDGDDGTGISGDTLLDRVMRMIGFNEMKSNMQSMPTVFRKGMAGDWKSHLTRDESDLIDQKVRDEWMGTGLESLWEQEIQRSLYV